MPKIDQATVLGATIPVPSREAQAQILVKVQEQFSLLDNLENAVARGVKRAESLRRAILRKAFAGELVPQNPDDEPASVLLERIKAERAASVPVKKTRTARAKLGQMELIGE